MSATSDTHERSTAHAVSYAENSAIGAVLGRVAASDPDGDTLTFSITGGNANGWYEINSSTGEITLTAAGVTSLANDFERQTNSRNLTVAASDRTNVTTIEVRLSETDLSDGPPMITGPGNKAGDTTDAVSIYENQTAVTRLTADKTVTWSISGGSEATRFAIGADGTLIFTPAPDYERPVDADANNTYILIITATDPVNGASAVQTITVTVLNTDDTAPLISGPNGGPGAAVSALRINEGLTALTTFTADEKVTWSLDGGSDAASFRIDPVTGALVFVATPDFELPTDSDRNNTYVVRIKAVDLAGNFSYQTLTVTAPIQLLGNDQLGKSARLLLSPGLLCEDNDVQLSVLRCGYQMGAKLVANDGGRNRFYADYHWESVAGMRRSLIGLGYASQGAIRNMIALKSSDEI